MVSHHHESVTFEEYLEVCRNNPDSRFEYHHGQVVMLAEGKLDYSRIAVNITAMLQHLFHTGSCQVFNSDAILRLPTGDAVLPDVTVSCDERDTGNNDYLHYPTVIFEVLSPSTEAIDRGQKLAWYRACLSLQEYVLVNTDRPYIELFRREKEPMWSYYTFGLQDTVPFTSINVSLSVQEIYRNVTFQN